MREDGFSSQAEGFNLQSLQQGLGAVLPGAMQGAAAGTSIAPGWGTLIGALGGAALSLASQASSRRPAPAALAPPIAAPQPPPIAAPQPPPTVPSSLAPPVGPAPGAAAALPSPMPAGGGAGGLAQLLALLQNPQVQQLVSSLTSGQQPSPAAIAGGTSAVLGTLGARPGAAEAEAAEGGGALGWLVSQRVARPT